MLLEAFMSLMCVLFLETLSIRCGASRDVQSRSSLSFTKAAHFSAWSNVNDVTLFAKRISHMSAVGTRTLPIWIR
jgi:hypothetical protein